MEEVTTLGFPSLSLGGFGFVVIYGSSLAAGWRIKRAISLNSHMLHFVKPARRLTLVETDAYLSNFNHM